MSRHTHKIQQQLNILCLTQHATDAEYAYIYNNCTSVGMEMCQMVNMASAASTLVQAIGRILRIPTATSACRTLYYDTLKKEHTSQDIDSGVRETSTRCLNNPKRRCYICYLVDDLDRCALVEPLRGGADRAGPQVRRGRRQVAQSLSVPVLFLFGVFVKLLQPRVHPPGQETLTVV